MDIRNRKKLLKTEFEKIFGKDNKEEIRFFSAPGRVNLIGEHTDYNGGFVLPCAIDKTIVVSARRRTDRILSMVSLDFNEKVKCSLDNLKYKKEDGWANYPKGVAKVLIDKGIKLTGAELLFQGEIPIASGLSSSAAIEVVTLVCLLKLSNNKIHAKDIALLAQKAENEFIGMKCGIMDQFIITFGKKDHALFIDCRSLDYKLIPFKLEDMAIVIGNTKVERKLVDSEYNKRRAECEEGVRILSKYDEKIKQLRDISVSFFEKHRNELPENVRKRCQHVVYENERVENAVKYLNENNITGFGKLMLEAHMSIKNLYEVSCFELDTMVEEALKIQGTVGARMTGAGFGGCTVNLVYKKFINEFIEKVGKNYKEKTGITPEFYITSPSDGVKEV